VLEWNEDNRLRLGVGIVDCMKDEMKKTYFDQINEMCKKLYPASLNINYFSTNFVVQGGFDLLC